MLEVRTDLRRGPRAGHGPILFAILPQEMRKPPPDPSAVAAGGAAWTSHDRNAFLVLAAILMLNGAVQTSISVHLLTILQGQGLSLAAAVAMGTLIGPAQVGARVAEMLVESRLRPTATLLAAGALIALGMTALAFGATTAAVAIVLYAAGNGVWSIARGAVPLALFGPARYAVIMGRRAAPNLIMQAFAPFVAGFLLAAAGPSVTIATLAITAAANVALLGLLMRTVRRGR